MISRRKDVGGDFTVLADSSGDVTATKVSGDIRHRTADNTLSADYSSSSIQCFTGRSVPLCKCNRQPIFAVAISRGCSFSRQASFRSAVAARGLSAGRNSCLQSRSKGGRPAPVSWNPAWSAGLRPGRRAFRPCCNVQGSGRRSWPPAGRCLVALQVFFPGNRKCPGHGRHVSGLCRRSHGPAACRWP